MTKFLRLTLIATFLILFCQLAYTMEKVVGSGKIAKEEREIRSVKAIHLSGFGQLNITQGKEEKLTIQAEDNILPYISSVEDDGYLLLGIKMPNNLTTVRPTKSIHYEITVKDLESIGLSGSGNINSTNTLHVDDLDVEVSGAGNISLTVESKDLEIEIAGSGNIEIKGNVEAQEVDIMGSGNYVAYDLASKKADVKIMGSGSAKVKASETLESKIYGSGSIFYKGSPELTQKVYGSGSIKKAS